MPASTATSNKSNRAVTPAPAAAPAAKQTSAAPTATAKSGKTAAPAHEDIAKRAYELYLARGKASGRETEDWIQAERELTARTNGRN